MMSKEAHYQYYDDDDVQVLGLPYKGGDISMYIILPRKRYGLEELEKQLTGKRLLSYIDECGNEKVEVSFEGIM